MKPHLAWLVQVKSLVDPKAVDTLGLTIAGPMDVLTAMDWQKARGLGGSRLLAEVGIILLCII